MNTNPNVSLFANARSKEPGQNLPIPGIIEAIRTASGLAEKIDAIRKAPTKDAADELKKDLPAFTPSGVFSVRNATGLLVYSGVIGIDVDDVGAERAVKIRADARNDPHGLAAFVSPRGNGVKLSYPVTTGPDQHRIAWENATNHVEKKYGVQVDRSGSDLPRLCFVSSDPGAWYNPNAVPLPIATSPAVKADTAAKDSAGGVDDLEHLSAPLDGVTIEDAKDALNHLDPDCDYDEWLDNAAALRHQFPHEPDASLAYQAWDEHSATGAKYKGSDDTREKWDSLKPNARGRRSTTIRSLFKRAKADGWVPTKEQADGVAAWIKSPERVKDGLRRQGIAKIAESPLPKSRREELLEQLRARLGEFGIKVSSKVLTLELAEAITSRRAAKPDALQKWARNFIYVASANGFYNKKTGRLIKTQAFDLYYGHLTGDSTPSSHLLDHCGLERAGDMAYHPGKPLLFIDLSGGDVVNTYRPTYPKPDYDQAGEAGRLLLRHMKNLIAEPEYQTLLIDFLAFLVQHPGEKVLWAPLIFGVQGCGKSSIGTVSCMALGYSNGRSVEASAAFEGSFNGFACNSQLVVFEEVRNVGENRFWVLDKIKPLITEPRIEVNRKYIESANVENVTNYLLFTNHADALAVNDNERRFFILKSPLQTQTDITAGDITRCCKELHEFLQSNPGAFRAFLLNWKISAGFDPKGHAPTTPYKTEMARATESPIKAAVRETLDSAESPELQPDLFAFDSLMMAVRNEPGCERTNAQTLSAIVSELGYVCAGRHLINGVERKRLYVPSNSPLVNRLGEAAARFKDRLNGVELKGLTLLD